jgi:hypothetical protein
MISLFDSAPRKCWVCDLAKLKPPMTIELLGTIVRLNEQQMTIDDGTGSVVVHFAGHAIKGQIGENVDCIARYEENNTLRADVVIWKVSPQTETLFQWQILEPPGKFGYPKLAFAKHDLLRYIRCAGGGAILEDLSLVVDRPINEIRPMIDELQNDGSIYQKRNGEYALL